MIKFTPRKLDPKSVVTLGLVLPAGWLHPNVRVWVRLLKISGRNRLSLALICGRPAQNWGQIYSLYFSTRVGLTSHPGSFPLLSDAVVFPRSPLILYSTFLENGVRKSVFFLGLFWRSKIGVFRTLLLPYHTFWGKMASGKNCTLILSPQKASLFSRLFKVVRLLWHSESHNLSNLLFLKTRCHLGGDCLRG